MNNAELDAQLKRASVPERPAEHWAEFPDRVLGEIRALPAGGKAMRGPRPAIAIRWLAGLGLAAAFLLTFIVLNRGPQRAATLPTAELAWWRDPTALREVLALFPRRVQAIAHDERGLRLVLSEQEDVPASPPLLIEIDDQGRRSSFVTFSGQSLQIAGEKIEVLANPQGQVTLLGERLFWSTATADGATQGRRIRAQTLAFSL